jgi:hypothetical protein
MTKPATQDGEELARGLVQQWVSDMLSVAPADRSAAEAAVEQLYRSLGHTPPRRIVWCAGPVELSTSRERTWLFEDVADNLVPLISDKLAHASCTYGEGAKSDPMSRRRSALITTSMGLHTALMNLVDLEAMRAKVGFTMRRIAKTLIGRRKPAQWFTVGIGGRSQTDAPYLRCEAYLYERYGQVPALRETLSALATIVASAGWIVPHQHVCWLCERPDAFEADPRARLHSARGPAIRYRDGFAVYAWKGVVVQPWMIEYPETITVGRITRERDPIVRRCMIEIMTPEKFIRAGGARVVARDDTGTLWMFTSGLDSWAAVEVINGTPEPDGVHKHYYLQVPPEMRTARQAVAWTYDLTESQYAGLVVRT